MSILDRFTSSKKKSLEVTIFPATEADPAYVVTAMLISQQETNTAYDQCTEKGELVVKKYAAYWGKKVLVGWVGLTIGNFRKLLPDLEINTEKLLEMCRIEEGGEIPYRPDLAADLWRAAEADVFSGKIKDALDEARDLQKEEVRIAVEKKAS